jgi:hypothetical protein
VRAGFHARDLTIRTDFPPRESTPGFPGAGKLLSSRGLAMPEFTDRWFFRLRAAQRDLIEACGTIERVAELTSMSKSQVGRWRSPTDADLMPVNCAMILEEDCGRPLISMVMADFSGYSLVAPDQRGKNIACLSTQVADLVGQVSSLMARTAQAGSDGFYSVAEVNELQKINSVVRSVADRLDDVLASAKAEGGVSVIRGGKGGAA